MPKTGRSNSSPSAEASTSTRRLEASEIHPSAERVFRASDRGRLRWSSMRRIPFLDGGRGAGGSERRAESSERRAESSERRAESRERRAVSGEQ